MLYARKDWGIGTRQDKDQDQDQDQDRPRGDQDRQSFQIHEGGQHGGTKKNCILSFGQQQLPNFGAKRQLQKKIAVLIHIDNNWSTLN